MPPRTIVLAALAALVLALAALASGCGGSSGNSGVAALDDQSSTSDDTNDSSGSGSGSSSSNSASDDPQDAALKWARCMRKNGVDVPDPEVNGGRITMRARAGTATSGVTPDSAKFRAAQKKCGTPFGNARPPQMSEADRAEFQDALLAFAKCMREHGVNMPDPKFGQGAGGGVFQFGGPGSGIDPQSPRFQAAQKACDPIMQKLRDKIGAPTTTNGPQ
jgi:hypothetical protein